jgi:four helix bundle protein
MITGDSGMQFGFEKLEVYQDSLEFADRIYELSKGFPKDEMFGIINQLRRAAASISANIAEGSSRGKKEFIRYLNISQGSAYECVPLLEISKRQSYLNNNIFTELMNDLHKISAKISALKNSLN